MSKYVEKVEKYKLPTVALKGMIMFPSFSTALDMENQTSGNALIAVNEISTGEKLMFVVGYKDPDGEENALDNLSRVGVVVRVKQSLHMPGRAPTKALVEGICRGEAVSYTMTEEDGYIMAEVYKKELVVQDPDELRASVLVAHAVLVFDEYSKTLPKVASEVVAGVQSRKDPGELADYLAAHVITELADKQRVLDEFEPLRRLEIVCEILDREILYSQMEKEISEKTKENIERGQREYYLREQLKVVSSELDELHEENMGLKPRKPPEAGEGEPEEEEPEGELDEMERLIREANPPEPVRKKLQKELNRMSKMSFGSPESTVVHSYIEACCDIPWSKKTHDRLDIKKAREVLDADHDGLEKVKDRIIEYLAVRQRTDTLRGQIICLVGAPGVGKTSVCASIARAMHRNYVRVSLGGVKDEADIRGHRKTYIGSMPGRIINALIEAKSMNPLMVLDEIDKLTYNTQGDPASALLEVLDSEQNHAFRDHFIELPVDLSDCMFIATANDTANIPRPLLDRMEIIELHSYTFEEKMAIAKNHLIPKQLKKHGLNRRLLRITDDALAEIIECYTREAGVRNLEREIARMCRRISKDIIENGEHTVTVRAGEVTDILDRHIFKKPAVSQEPVMSVANGLAWTQAGGDMLKAEVISMPGTGKIEITGSLGDVMKESAKLAVSYIRSRSDQLGITDKEFYKNRDIHIHFPEGAVPKDGPSAGVTMVCALVSELTGRPVRSDVAMTGEISLRGDVLPIGGLREKTTAAYTNGIKTVIIPYDNLDDLADVDPKVRESLNFITARQVETVIQNALLPLPTASGETA